MTRLDGFLFRYPGFPSLVVPYHDSDDFYYSGHIGACTILFLECKAQGWTRYSYMCLFVLCNVWAFMTFIRTHYVIDMVTAVIVAHYTHMIAEKVSYFIDVKIMRQNLAKTDERKAAYFEHCESCGWSNKCAKNYLPEKERAILRKIYCKHNGGNQEVTKIDPNHFLKDN